MTWEKRDILHFPGYWAQSVRNWAIYRPLNCKDFIVGGGGKETHFCSEARFYENSHQEKEIKSFVIYSVVQKTKL